jgi:hypothetical protein
MSIFEPYKYRMFPLRPTGPTSVRELVRFLGHYPRVRITGPTPDSREPVTRDETFLRLENGRLWFMPVQDDAKAHHIPIGCAITEAAAQAEAGITFDDAGFTVTKFGVPIRIEYQP